MRYLISLLLSMNFLNASLIYSDKNICIEDFYVSNGSFYYLQSSDNGWYVTSSINQVQTIFPNYKFDVATQKCTSDTSYLLGLESTQYYFLMAFIGVIFGGVFMFFTIQIFTMVGGRR